MCITDHFKLAGMHSVCLSFVFLFFSPLSLSHTRWLSLALSHSLKIRWRSTSFDVFSERVDVLRHHWSCLFLFIFVRTLPLDLSGHVEGRSWSGTSTTCSKTLYTSEWVHLHLDLELFYCFFQLKSHVSQQVPDANAAHTFPTWTCRCFIHPEMWTRHLSGWANLLRTGKQQCRRHLLQAACGQDVL